MFCPACGFEERQASAFCRKCGGDLRPVLAALQNPESAGSGRDEVYRSLAARIKDGKAKDVKELVEKVLPKIERRVGDRTGRALSGATSSGGAGLPASEWSVSETNPRAKFYRLNAAGKKRPQQETESWNRLASAIEPGTSPGEV